METKTLKNNKRDYDDIVLKFIELLERSEERIDKTNDMIFKMVATIDKLSAEYTKQLTKLQEVRDEVVAQNRELIKLAEACKKESEYSNKRYDTLLEKMFWLKNNSSENNFNINQ